jgi:hypothetical protein
MTNINKFEPELGQLLYSLCDAQSYEIYEPLTGACESIRHFMKVLLDIDPFANGGEEYKGEKIHIQAYSWAECNCDTYWEGEAEECACGFEEQKYNLYWKGDNLCPPFVISWYKYFRRGTSVSTKLTDKQVGHFMVDVIHELSTKNA